MRNRSEVISQNSPGEAEKMYDKSQDSQCPAGQFSKATKPEYEYKDLALH